ncbi:MAG TPA: glycosyltransferase family 39 protein [Thermoanaerobaculia bacterium]
MPRTSRWVAAFAVLALADLLWVAPRLLVPDLNLDYPFTDGDSWDWIANGLAFAGHPVRDPGRSPLLPLLLAALARLGALELWPLLQQALVHATAVGFVALATRLHGPRAALATGVALLFNHSYQGLSVDLMADVLGSCLLFAAAAAFVIAAERPRAYLAAGLAGGLAALAQQAALLAVLPAGAAVLVTRRRHLRARALWAGAVLFLALQIAWLLVKQARYATFGDVLTRYSTLLRLHDGGSLGAYLWSLASLLGLPGAILLATGVGLALLGLRASDSAAAGRLFLAGTVLVLFLFFACAYDFHAKRFLAVAYWVGGLLIAEVLARLRHPALFWATAGMFVGGSLLPLPAPGRDPSYVALWPIPPVYARAELTFAATGAAAPNLARIEIVRLPLREVLAAEHHALLREAARRLQPAPRLDPALLAADRGALYLYAPGEAGARYRTVTRLGNAVRKPLKFVPAAWLEPYYGLVEVKPLGRVDEAEVFRARVRGLAGTWLLAAAADGPVRTRLAAAAAAPPPPRAVRRGRVERGRRRAHAVAAWLAESDAYVALLPGPEQDLARLYLPFLLETTELYVVEPEQEAGARGMLAAAPLRAERRFGPLHARRVELYGRPSAVIENGD